MGIIEATGLTRKYGAVTAVEGLDLDVREGSVTGFLGPNGAGKTTTIRMLLGLVHPTAGSVRVCGQPVIFGQSARPQQVAAIVETPAFYGALSAIENLRVLSLTAGLRLSQAQLEKQLERLGLSGRGHEPVRGFSLGMKQRLGVASVLMQSPKVLFLDEPTNGLDPQGQADMRELLKALPNEGHTVFVSSHLLRDVEQTCTELIIVDRGRKVTEGKVAELLRAGSRVVFKVNDPAAAIALVRRERPQLTVGEGIELSVQVPRDASADQLSADLVKLLVNADVQVFSVATQAADLERLFLQLTGKPS
ncbi:MAG: ABC transporter ATP-binding protein [Archangium sp.]|nr:ABC transporter ATP-binding protein [Archangium sp.]